MSKRNTAQPSFRFATYDYRVRIAATSHWSAACKTIRVHAGSAADARAEALRHRAVAAWPDRVVVWARRMPRR